MSRIVTQVLLGSLLIGVSSTSLAASYEPARVGNSPNSLPNSIRFPDVPGEYTVYVRCEARVQPAGNIEEIGCYSDPDIDSRFYRAINLAAENATFTSARVDGEAVNTLVLFTVLFRSQGDQRIKAVIPNHGTNAKQFGLNYVAPQRYGNNFFTPRSEIGLLWADAEVSVNGEVEDLEFVETQWSDREAKRYGKEYMEGNRFMPGFVEGEPTTMRFVKPIYGFRNGFLWMDDASRCGASHIACDEVSDSGTPRYVFDD